MYIYIYVYIEAPTVALIPTLRVGVALFLGSHADSLWPKCKSPASPDCLRHADSSPPDRKNGAEPKPGSPGLHAIIRVFVAGP